MSKPTFVICVILPAVILSAVAAGDTLVLTDGSRLVGEVFPAETRYLVFLADGRKVFVPMRQVARVLKGDQADGGAQRPAEVVPAPPVKNEPPPARVKPIKGRFVKTSVTVRTGAAVHGVAMLGDGSHFATGGPEANAAVYSTANGTRVKTMRTINAKGPVTAMQLVNIDGWLTLIAGIRREGVVWNVRSGKEIRYFGGYSRSVEAVVYRASDKAILVASRKEMTVRSYANAKTMIKHSIGISNASVAAVAFSTDGTRMASAHRDRRMREWDATADKLFGMVTGKAMPQSAPVPTSVSCRGAWVVGSIDKTIVAQQRQARKSVELTGHGARIVTVVDCRERPYVAVSCDTSGELRLWDLALGRLVTSTRMPAAPTCMDLSDDGTTLVVGFKDGTATVWNIDYQGN